VTGELSAYWRDHVGAVVVVAEGTLDAASYGKLRDTLAKVAADAPRAVIVDLDRTVLRGPLALALFPTVASEIAVWPGIPLILLVADNENHRVLAEYRMRRYVAVHRSLEAAVGAIGDPPPRRVARVVLPYGSACFPLARAVVTDWCARWRVTETRTADALRIATALVDNTIRHTQGPPTIRIELRRGMLTVAVYDANPQPARPIEPGTDPSTATEHGLTMIGRMCRTWGSTSTQSGGKVVWGVL
jgi:hypothetical protein